jgi:alpha-L-rhamnosidase
MLTSAIFLLALVAPAAEEQGAFRTARPIWPEGRETEMNLMVGFRAVIEPPASQGVILRLAGSTIYRAKVNGQFVGHGPARGPHGYYRVDEWDLSPHLKKGRNVVSIEVAGYNVNSYYLLDQPAFLQAEVVCNNNVLASTAGQGTPFEAAVLTERVQKTQRYSFQRPFTEVYRLKPDSARWQVDPQGPFAAVRCAIQPAKSLLPRRVAYPTFNCRPACWHVAQGMVKTGIAVDKPWKDRSLTDIGPKLKGYEESELETIPSIGLQYVANDQVQAVNQPLSAGGQLALGTNTFHILDLGTNLTGFVAATINCRESTRLFLTFDEVLSKGDVDFKRLGCVNIITLDLEPGTYWFESIEPYTMRYLKAIVLSGGCEISEVYLREYVNPEAGRAHFAASDDRLNRLFEAARQTFAQNALDVFMDCPSRERAGWLCDSFFTARTAFDLTGRAVVERNMMENYLLPPKFEYIPDGMLPMCYPADHNDGVYIPNWAMWFVIQLEEYQQRSGDRATVEALKPRVMKLLDYLRGFENADGLLEKLSGWVFVEWSKAASFVQDVNYPTNALYAGTLTTAARLYDRSDLAAKADRIRETIRSQSYDGQFFVDNALRKNDKLEITRNRTEVCQYYCFYFGVATTETHGELWKTLVTQFGPKRQQSKAFPEIYPANSFVGNVLRLELLSRQGLGRQLLDESVDFHLYMADRTGTLWENVGDYASCNHGFASHLAHVLIRDVLGLYRIDPVRKVARLRLGDVGLDWCRGTIPTPDGPVSLQWTRTGDELSYCIEAPAGYEIDTAAIGPIRLVRRP